MARKEMQLLAESWARLVSSSKSTEQCQTHSSDRFNPDKQFPLNLQKTGIVQV